MSNVNIKRAVENIRANTTVYTPVVEMIVNAIQAIGEGSTTDGQVSIRAQRADFQIWRSAPPAPFRRAVPGIREVGEEEGGQLDRPRESPCGRVGVIRGLCRKAGRAYASSLKDFRLKATSPTVIPISTSHSLVPFLVHQ